jgi:hypothetical protein
MENYRFPKKDYFCNKDMQYHTKYLDIKHQEEEDILNNYDNNNNNNNNDIDIHNEYEISINQPYSLNLFYSMINKINENDNYSKQHERESSFDDSIDHHDYKGDDSSNKDSIESEDSIDNLLDYIQHKQYDDKQKLYIALMKLCYNGGFNQTQFRIILKLLKTVTRDMDIPNDFNQAKNELYRLDKSSFCIKCNQYEPNIKRFSDERCQKK